MHVVHTQYMHVVHTHLYTHSIMYASEYQLNCFQVCAQTPCICTCTLGNMYTRTTQDYKFASCPLLSDVVPLSTDMHIRMHTFYLFQ